MRRVANSSAAHVSSSAASTTSVWLRRAASNRQQSRSGLGFNKPLGKAPQVRQGQDVRKGAVSRVPGTTKVVYTNDKGRRFTFSIPVAELTHPPVLRESPSPDGWREIDTSFVDTGELGDEMPLRVSEQLRQSLRRAPTGEMTVALTGPELVQLAENFRADCEEYVLMDTSGMKTSTTHAELNTGPDYEMYDRKLMRKRFWLSLRHHFDDIKELLWPSSVLEDSTNGGTAEDDAADADAPTLDADVMIRTLTWVEAASTFCVRARHAYDLADASDFEPIDLHREVRVAAARARQQQLLSRLPSQAPVPDDVINGTGEDTDTAADPRARSDLLISCATLCATHRVSFTSFFEESSDAAGAPVGAPSALLLCLMHLPPLTRTKDGIRLMRAILASTTPQQQQQEPRRPLSFTSVPNGKLLPLPHIAPGLYQLCGPDLFASLDALQNVDESDLCVLMEFVVLLRESNPEFFAANWSDDADVSAERKLQSVLDHFTNVCLARCRYLLYSLGGPQTTVMSGDDEHIPFVEMQKYTEQANPEVRVHGAVGMQNALGLRFASLQPRSSSRLVELLGRLERSGRLQADTQTLSHDLVQHLARRVAFSKSATLSMPEMVQVLPVLAETLSRRRRDSATVVAPEAFLRSRGDPSSAEERVLSVISASVGAELCRAQPPTVLVDLLRGLALCRFPTRCYKQMEAVLTRVALSSPGVGAQRSPGALTLAQQASALHSLAVLSGEEGPSPVLVHHIASNLASTVAAQHENPDISLWSVTRLLRTLRFCHYSGLPSLVRDVLSAPQFSHISLAEDVDTVSQHVVAETLLSCGVLNSIVAAATEDAAWRDAAVRGLRVGLSRLPANVSDFDGDITVDLLLEVIVSCAALNMEAFTASPEVATALDARFRAATKSSDSVHSLTTPRFATIVLQSLEDLGLTDRLSDVADANVGTVAQHIRSMPDDVLLARQDVDLLLQLVGLQCAAARREVVPLARRRLAAELLLLEGAGDGDGGSSRNAPSATPPSRSFEQTALQQMQMAAETAQLVEEITEALQQSA